jgi:hypothetical protein
MVLIHTRPVKSAFKTCRKTHNELTEWLMRKQIIAVAVAAINLCALRIASAQTGSILDALSGVWSAEPLRIRLSSDFDVSVWGPNASSLRKVELAIQPSGEGMIKVTRSVVDARGRTKPGSVSVEEAQLLLHVPNAVDMSRIEPVVDVLKPQRRYLDDPGSGWPLDGLVVKLVGTDLEHDRLNVQFELPDGRGSFGETLVRQRPARAGHRAP